MMELTYTILINRLIAKNTYELVLTGDTSAFTTPGQFLNLSLPGFYLRRPFSICDWAENRARVIYKVLGRGTDHLTTLLKGTKLSALSGLGQGFDTTKSGQTPLLLGGGVGVPPLYRLCKDLVKEGKQVHVALGFGTAEEAFLMEEFQALGARVHLATLDGSQGIQGTVLDACEVNRASFFYACGPTPMLKAICQRANIKGQVSLEERMGCGFGACVGCTVITREGPQRVCKEGPVFSKEAVLW